MLPGRVVGSVMVGGKARPFSLDVPSGSVAVDRFEKADRMQRSLGKDERRAIEEQVKRAAGVSVASVRLGEYCCPECGRWVDVVADPDGWASDRCARCA